MLTRNVLATSSNCCRPRREQTYRLQRTRTLQSSSAPGAPSSLAIPVVARRVTTSTRTGIAWRQWRIQWAVEGSRPYWLRICLKSLIFPYKRHIIRCVLLRQMTTGLIHCVPPSPFQKFWIRPACVHLLLCADIRLCHLSPTIKTTFTNSFFIYQLCHSLYRVAKNVATQKNHH